VKVRDRVREILEQVPENVVNDTAMEALARIAGLELADPVPAGDVAWLLAMFMDVTPRDARVHRVTLTDGIEVRSEVGS
jgi:hypothetical protein